MAPTLEVILKNLQSDKNRLAFLEKIYTPGNIEVADRILTMSPDSSTILKREMAHAREQGQEDRFVAMGRKLVDYHVDNDFDILLSDIVVGWGNKPLADYAISRLFKKEKEDSLEYAAEIAMKFGREDEGRKLMERVFDVQMARSGKEYPFSPAGTAVKLGRFDEAINLYIKAGYHWLNAALKVAREHVPERVKEIATLGFDEYDSDRNHNPELYLESARILGKEGEAEKVLKKEARKLRVDSPPRFYEGLVNALVSLGSHDEARSVAERVEAYEVGQMQIREYYDSSNQRELARIFLALGDKGKAAEAFLRKIDKQLLSHHPSHFVDDIDEVYKLTGDKTVLQKKLFVFEREGQYDEAAGLARELGRTDLAEMYDTMQSMISAVQSQAK